MRCQGTGSSTTQLVFLRNLAALDEGLDVELPTWSQAMGIFHPTFWRTRAKIIDVFQTFSVI